MNVTPRTFPRITLDGDVGTAHVQMVTVLEDDDGNQVGSEQYQRHVLQPDDDDTNEHPDVKRARAGFVTPGMLARRQAQRKKNERGSL